LLLGGSRVICLDSFLTGSRANLRALIGHRRFTLIEHDICTPIDLGTPVDQVYNLACAASPPRYQADPLHTMMTSVSGTAHLLAMAENSGARFVQASTSEVYGDPEIHPQVEAYWGRVNPIGLRSCYDEGKRCAETLFFDYHRQHQLRVKVVRIFNTYGPRMHLNDGRVVSNFIVQALKGEDITIYGDGQQTRSFCYVDDLLDAMLRMMATGDEVPGPINIGNPGEFSMLELANKVIELTGSKSKLVRQPLPADDPKQRRPDISLAQQELGGWAPRTQLEEGLKKTIAYFDQVLSEPTSA
jgi:UDP-glucuronate decarboxylase